MLLTELLKKCNYDDVYKKICIIVDIKNDSYEYYLKMFNELKNLEYNKNEVDKCIYITEMPDEFGQYGMNYYSTYMLQESDIEKFKNKEINEIIKYDFVFNDWKEILGYTVSDTCIFKYGVELIVGIILYELSFLGNDYKTVKTKNADLIKILTERVNDFKAENVRCYSGEEVINYLKEMYGLK